MDLYTRYLGLDLKNPVVPSASPLARDLGNLRRMEDAGAAAVVLHSLFEEEINAASRTLDRYLSSGANSHAEALSYFYEAPSYRGVGPEEYLRHVQEARLALDIPVIASLNGVSTGGWLRFAREIERAGASALELNIYYLPVDPLISGAEVEVVYEQLVRDVRDAVALPLAVKLSPYFSATANMARRLVNAGAEALVLFNRFYQPDLDLEALAVVPNLVLSTAAEMRLPLRWIALLYGRVEADLALTTGVRSAEEVLKGVAAGAAVTMLTSELLRNGISRITTIVENVGQWLEDHEYSSLDELRGSLSQLNCAAPAAFERANYMQMLNSYTFDAG